MKGSLCRLKYEKGHFSTTNVDSPEGNDCQEAPNDSRRGSSRLSLSYSSNSSCVDTGDVNANSTREGGGPTRPLPEALSPAGHFAYCGLVTEMLHHLYADYEQDLDFAKDTLDRFLMHVNLPHSTSEVMKMTLKGEVGSGGLGNYCGILRSETILSKNFVPLVQDLVAFSVQGGNYDARTRVLINYCANLMNVSPSVVEMLEESVLEFLTEGHVAPTEDEQAREMKRARNDKWKRYALISVATVSGGALLGLTGGLAAPLIGAGLGTFIGAGGAAAIASTTGVAVLGSIFGAAGAGLTGYKMKKRVGEVEEFSFEFLTHGSSLHVTIVISGWLRELKPEAFTKPWRLLYNSREQYYLRYESKYLLELGQAMDLLLSFAFSVAVQESLKYTILAGIISAITWPTSLLTLASVIDNPWGVCIRRSAEAGRQMAQVLLQRHHGRRPVTLIGFSLGARVIYYCLKELAQRKGSAGIVQEAIMLGAPVPGYTHEWKKFGRVVCGRIVNGYCQTDWLLRFLYRTSSASLRIAGLEPVEWKDRRMYNYDLSHIVSGHSDYEEKLTDILHLLGVQTRDHDTRPAAFNQIKKCSSTLSREVKNEWFSVSNDLCRSVSDSDLHLRSTTSNYSWIYSSRSSLNNCQAQDPKKLSLSHGV